MTAKIDEISTVCFIGAGTMGSANALVAAVSGYDVVLHDAKPETLDTVAARHADIGAFLVAAGYCTDDHLVAGLSRVSLEADLATAVADAQLVSESVFEDLDLKREIHASLDEACPAGTVLTTNTSALLVSDIEDVVARGDRFAALHSHLGSLLFDIVGGPRTTADTIDILRRYVLSLGGIPLVLEKEHPGYVFNSMNGALLAKAMRLVLDDYATSDDVDRTWMADRQAPMGPFGMIDLFGIDLVLDAWRRPSDDPAREALRSKVMPFLASYVDAGKLGQKSGSGFYDYPSPAYADPDFAASGPSGLVSGALLSALICSAVSLVAKGIASRDNVDLAWTAATSLDAGPFAILDQLGTDAFADVMANQVAVELLSPEVAQLTEAYLRQTGEQ